MSPETITSVINHVKKCFSAMMTKIQQNQAARTAGNQGSAAQAASQSGIPLNASNLQQLQQQEEALQRARRANPQTVPPEPTSLQPPFAIGPSSPQGVPQAYG